MARDYLLEVQDSLNQPHSVTVSNYTEVAYLGALFETALCFCGTCCLS